MVLIEVSRHLTGCDTNEQGEKLLDFLVWELSRNDYVEVSFADVSSASSSFVNSSFVPLLATMSFDEIKKRIRITRANSQIAGMLRGRLAFESARLSSPPAAA